MPILFSCHAPHIALMADAKTSKAKASKGKKGAANACPICGKPADAVLRPFCSKRCADVDLHRWLAGVYVVPVTEDEEEEDERRDESDDSRQ
jgi:endogenous inhibitor of DNA gyrase (YacG/DUF329 family)